MRPKNLKSCTLPAGSAWLLLLLLLRSVTTPVASQGLRGGHHKCKPEQEGQYLPFQMASVTVQCKCAGGILEACRVVSAEFCEEKMAGCHFADSGAGGGSICPEVCKGCTDSNGTAVSSGTVWRDGQADPCSKSTCFSGVVTVTEVQCPPATCSDPVVRPGECCPYCEEESRAAGGCERGRLPFIVGETKPDPLDPCNECTCERSGRLTCERRACPVLPCEERLQRTEKGKCCPVCSRLSQAPPVINGQCLFRGKTYPRGSTFSPDSCTNCTCGSAAAEVSCSRRTCPPTPCSENEQVKDPNTCCPTCPSAPSPASSRSDYVRSLPATRPSHCEHDGDEHADGSNWETSCHVCSCSAGETLCEKKVECPELRCPRGSRPSAQLKPGQCCPECVKSSGTCTVFGDPHQITFDGAIFNFQGSCKYLLASDCQHGVGNGIVSNASSAVLERRRPSFSIRITNDARDSMAFSWLRTVTVRLHGIKVSLMQNMKVKVDGKKVRLPYLDYDNRYSHSFSIMKDGYRIILRSTTTGLMVIWDGVSFLEVSVPESYRGKLCGLCGNFNGDRSDDFYGRDGSVHPDGQSFGDTWRVGGLRACSVLPRDMPKHYEPQCTQSWESKIASDRNCNALRSTLFHGCAAIVDTDYYYNACKLDVCECPGETCHCEVLTAYARECERKGVFVRNWREATGCQNVSSFKWDSKNSIHLAGGGSNPLSATGGGDGETSLNEVSQESRSAPAAKKAPGSNLHYSAIEEDRIGEYLPGCTLANAAECGSKVTKGAQKALEAAKKRLEREQRRRERKRRRKMEKRKRQRMRETKRKLMKSHIRRPPGGSRKRNKGKRNKKKQFTSDRQKSSSSTSRLALESSRSAWSAMSESGSSSGDSKSPFETEDEDDPGETDYAALLESARLSWQGRAAGEASLAARTPLPLMEDDGEEAGGASKREFKRRRRRKGRPGG